MKFYICKHCGNIVSYLKNSGVSVMCCGQKMEELVPNTVDAAKEKHVPVVEINGTTVKVVVGEVPHPSLPEHHIEWIALECVQGNQRKLLKVGPSPLAYFELTIGDKVVAAYEYCNLHGLWKKEL